MTLNLADYREAMNAMAVPRDDGTGLRGCGQTARNRALPAPLLFHSASYCTSAKESSPLAYPAGGKINICDKRKETKPKGDTKHLYYSIASHIHQVLFPADQKHLFGILQRKRSKTTGKHRETIDNLCVLSDNKEVFYSAKSKSGKAAGPSARFPPPERKERVRRDPSWDLPSHRRSSGIIL